MKGQYTMIGVMGLLLAFIGFGAVIASSEFTSNQVKYNTGDFNEIAAAKMKAEGYQHRMPQELKYSANIVALELGENEADWSKSSGIPSNSNLRSEFLEAVASEFRTQNRVLRCQPPEINTVNRIESENLHLKALLKTDSIKCETSSTEASVSIGTDELSVQNKYHHYLNLSEQATALAQESERIIDEKDWKEGEATRSACDDRSLAEERSLSDAKNKAGKIKYIHNKAISNTDIYSFVYFLEKDTELVWDNNTISQKDGKCSVEVDCEEQAEQNLCVEERQSYNATSTAQVDKVIVDFKLKDGWNTVINQNGNQVPIKFDFNYTRDFS